MSKTAVDVMSLGLAPLARAMSPKMPNVDIPSQADVAPPPPTEMPDAGDVALQKKKLRAYTSTLQGGAASTILGGAGTKLGG